MKRCSANVCWRRTVEGMKTFLAKETSNIYTTNTFFTGSTLSPIFDRLDILYICRTQKTQVNGMSTSYSNYSNTIFLTGRIDHLKMA